MSMAIGPAAASVISFVILFSIMGATNANFLCSPRVYYAMAKDGAFFKPLASVHAKYATPHVSIVALGVWSLVLSLSGTFEQLLAYVVFGQWIFFGLTVFGVFVLRKKRPDLPRPYRTWGYPDTPAIFVLAALYVTVNSLILQFKNSMIGLGIILLGLPFYVFWRIRSKRISGAGAEWVEP